MTLALAGEFALANADLDGAVASYVKAAQASDDPAIAVQATHVALAGKRWDAAQTAYRALAVDPAERSGFVAGARDARDPQRRSEIRAGRSAKTAEPARRQRMAHGRAGARRCRRQEAGGRSARKAGDAGSARREAGNLDRGRPARIATRRQGARRHARAARGEKIRHGRNVYLGGAGESAGRRQGRRARHLRRSAQARQQERASAHGVRGVARTTRRQRAGGEAARARSAG